ncbi:MAG: two-component system phosphate regulon response regulator PhoB [Pseudohongiellaceae bacterium]|jgi:two-component system phosphate regulon response regulator PhoB
MSPKGHTILIVNNAPFLSEAITLTLESAGFEWLRANNKDEAYSIITQTKPLCILLDWIPSGTTYIDFIHNFKQDERSCNIPILLLTPKIHAEKIFQGLEAGADDCMTKPLSHTELIARLKAILRRTTPALAL